MKPKILAFLQNQWFKDPERVKEMYDRSPQHRNEYIRHFLFMGCLTGRRLSTAFGDEICQQHIIWEEISPEIGGVSSSKFPADIPHIQAAIYKHKPDVVIALGKIAENAIAAEISARAHDSIGLILYGPHPAARTNPMPRLNEIGKELKKLIEEAQ